MPFSSAFKLIGLACLLVISPRAASQHGEPLDFFIPLVVQDSIHAYVRSLDLKERGEPFLIFRGGWWNTYEVAVRVGTRSRCDSLLLSSTNRIARGSFGTYGIVLAGETRFISYREPNPPPPFSPHAARLTCALQKEQLYVIRFFHPYYGSEPYVIDIRMLDTWW